MGSFTEEFCGEMSSIFVSWENKSEYKFVYYYFIFFVSFLDYFFLFSYFTNRMYKVQIHTREEEEVINRSQHKSIKGGG